MLPTQSCCATRIANAGDCKMRLERSRLLFKTERGKILIDKLGIAHTVDRSQTEFIIQKKAIPFIAFFDQNPLKAEALISSYIRAVESQCKKGISNLDPRVDRNYGVIGTHVILMDIGSFVAYPKLSYKAEVLREIFLELLPLRQWLQKNHPEHVAYFDRSVQRLLSN